MCLLKQEARRDRTWRERVSTQAGLEQWAVEVRYKDWMQSRYEPGAVTCMLAEARLGPRSFPLSGLSDLEPDWQDVVIEVITKPPVSQILKVSTFTPSLSKSIPIAFVERTPIPLAV